MPKRHDYVTVDVFTDRAFAGNPLAVVTDATGLHPTRMQAIAAEFTYSESTFVLPPEDPAHTARVRIFTRQNEIPFAGHPNVGTAFAPARLAASRSRPAACPSTSTRARRAGAVSRVRVGGRCAPVMDGTLAV